MPRWQNFAGGRTLESGRLQPRTKLSGCSTCGILWHLCICNVFVRSHPLCPKWAAAPWHTGAKSKVFPFLKMLVQNPSTVSQSVSQSVRPGRLTASPFRAQVLHFTYVACSLAAKISKRIEMLLPKFTVLWCHLPMNPSLVVTVHLQFALSAQFWTSESPLPHGLPMQNSSYPVVSGALNIMRCQFPIRTTTHSRPALKLRDANKVCCSFIPSKCPKFHAMRVSSQCTAEGPQWIGRIHQHWNLCQRNQKCLQLLTMKLNPKCEHYV